MNSTKRCILFCALLLAQGKSDAQDCFDPPSGHTLYTTNNPIYTFPAKTGFVTYSKFENGDWQVSGMTGTAGGHFIDDSGHSSTIEISGEGTLFIDAEVTDVSVFPFPVTNCTQDFDLVNYIPVVATNPPLRSPCPLNVVVVLDESGSIADASIDQNIRDGLLTLANILNSTGSSMAVVEFNSRADHVEINGSTALQLVDASFIGGLETYLLNDYEPSEDPVNLVGGTNWEEGLSLAHNIAGATMILLITDGNPTFYTVGSAMMGSIAGEGDMFDLTALKEAQDVANDIKNSGKHLFVIGVDIPLNVQPIKDISGPNAFPIGGSADIFYTSDYVSVSSSQITRVFGDIGIMTCGVIVPTLNEWSLIILSLLFLIFGVVYIKQNKSASFQQAAQ